MSTVFRLNLLSPFLKYFPTPIAYISSSQNCQIGFSNHQCQTQPFTKAVIQSIPYNLCWCLKTMSKLHFIIREPETLTLYLHFFINGLVSSSGEWGENTLLQSQRWCILQVGLQMDQRKDAAWIFLKLLCCLALLIYFNFSTAENLSKQVSQNILRS